MKTLAFFLVLTGCPPALVDAPPTPTPTPVAVSSGVACYSYSDCGNSEMCVDPRYPVCGNQPACADLAPGTVQCGCECKNACTATSCAADEVCGAGGCCQPKTCSADSQCGGVANTRCVEGRCARRGTCSPPVP